MTKLFRFWLFVFATICIADVAHADGVVNAASYAPLPDKLAIEVRPFDDSDENLAIKERIERELAARGITTGAKAPLVMNFEVRNRIGYLNTGDNRHVIEFQTRGGRSGGEQTDARINVFNSQSGGLLNKGPGTRVSNRTVYRLELNVEQRDNNERLWDGWVEAELTGGDSAELLRRMVPAVVKALGQTVKSQAFSPY
jgi:hypothetical protein